MQPYMAHSACIVILSTVHAVCCIIIAITIANYKYNIANYASKNL